MIDQEDEKFEKIYKLAQQRIPYVKFEGQNSQGRKKQNTNVFRETFQTNRIFRDIYTEEQKTLLSLYAFQQFYKNKRFQTVWENTKYPHCCVGIVICVNFDKKIYSYGTGFLIDTNMVLTCAHIIVRKEKGYDFKADQCWFVPGLSSLYSVFDTCNALNTEEAFEVLTIGMPDLWRKQQHYLFDFAILRLKIHIGIYLGYFGVEFDQDISGIKQIYTSGYPQKDKQNFQNCYLNHFQSWIHYMHTDGKRIFLGKPEPEQKSLNVYKEKYQQQIIGLSGGPIFIQGSQGNFIAIGIVNMSDKNNQHTVPVSIWIIGILLSSEIRQTLNQITISQMPLYSIQLNKENSQQFVANSKIYQQFIDFLTQLGSQFSVDLMSKYEIIEKILHCFLKRYASNEFVNYIKWKSNIKTLSPSLQNHLSSFLGEKVEIQRMINWYLMSEALRYQPKQQKDNYSLKKVDTQKIVVYFQKLMLSNQFLNYIQKQASNETKLIRFFFKKINSPNQRKQISYLKLNNFLLANFEKLFKEIDSNQFNIHSSLDQDQINATQHPKIFL